MRWSNGDQYVGEWKDGKKHGLGKMTSLDGNFFEGTWKNDLRDFSKPFVNPDRKVAYVVWDNSIPISRKKYVYDGDESLKRLIKKKIVINVSLNVICVVVLIVLLLI